MYYEKLTMTLKDQGFHEFLRPRVQEQGVVFTVP